MKATRQRIIAAAAALLCSAIAQTAYAADEPAVRQSAVREEQPQPALSELITPNANPEQGVSANEILGMPVRAANGQALGKVDDLIIDPHGGVILIVRTPRGQRLRLAWSQAEFSSGKEVRAARGGKLEPLASARRQTTEGKPNAPRLKQLVGNPVVTGNGTRYGTVQDFRIGQNGEVSAVMVDSEPPFVRHSDSG